jgi:hypothetical protein
VWLCIPALPGRVFFAQHPRPLFENLISTTFRFS